jgi:hypothetical protein
MHQMRISTTEVSSVMLRSKKLEIRKKIENWKSCLMKTKTECHETEPNPSKDRAIPEGDNPSFWDKFHFFFYFLYGGIYSRWKFFFLYSRPPCIREFKKPWIAIVNHGMNSDPFYQHLADSSRCMNWCAPCEEANHCFS